MGRRKYTGFHTYEGPIPDDKHIRLTKEMMMNPNYIGLSNSAKILYNYMKLWSNGVIEYQYSWSLAKTINLYGSNTTYIKAKNELIDNGFIKCVRTSKCSREPNKYRFITDWIKK